MSTCVGGSCVVVETEADCNECTLDDKPITGALSALVASCFNWLQSRSLIKF